jgi:hypothetical protein
VRSQAILAATLKIQTVKLHDTSVVRYVMCHLDGIARSHVCAQLKSRACFTFLWSCRNLRPSHCCILLKIKTSVFSSGPCVFYTFSLLWIGSSCLKMLCPCGWVVVGFSRNFFICWYYLVSNEIFVCSLIHSEFVGIGEDSSMAYLQVTLRPFTWNKWVKSQSTFITLPDDIHLNRSHLKIQVAR